MHKTINKTVFFMSSFLIFGITFIGSFIPDLTDDFFHQIQTWLIYNTSWTYILGVASIFIFSLWLLFTRLGDIKLGPDHSGPEYSNSSWIAMLFSAGMGIGLLFFGVSEPLMHYMSPPVGEGETIRSAQEALKITFFHWGLHAWAIYATFAVILSYFCYRKKLPLLPRSIFYPLLGDKIYGTWGDFIDTFSVIGTMFGVATSLGFGVTQVNAGLFYLFDIPQTKTVQVILIVIITLMATISVVLGLDGGIKKLSNLNMIFAILLLVTVLLIGDTPLLLKSYVQNTGAYLSDIIYRTFNLYAYEKKESWIGGWTLLYWGWWVSWAPFVGIFIARISRGRTIREFMAGVLFIPAGFTFLWMTVFGNSAIKIASTAPNGSELLEVVKTNVPVAIFKFFEYYPFSVLLVVLALFLVVTFFVSSSDSGSLVIDTLASGGQMEPPVWQRIYWALLEGVVAAVLLLSGGLDALQTMAICSAMPVMIMILLGMVSFIKSLKEDYLLFSSVRGHHTTVQYSKTSTPWRDRLQTIIEHPRKQQVYQYIQETVRPALNELAEELKNRSLDVKVSQNGDESIRLIINKEGVEDFSYGVRVIAFLVPEYFNEDYEKYYRAEVFLSQGGQNYDIYGYSKDQLIVDAISQYERHLYYLHLTNSEKA